MFLYNTAQVEPSASASANGPPGNLQAPGYSRSSVIAITEDMKCKVCNVRVRDCSRKTRGDGLCRKQPLNDKKTTRNKVSSPLRSAIWS